MHDPMERAGVFLAIRDFVDVVLRIHSNLQTSRGKQADKAIPTPDTERVIIDSIVYAVSGIIATSAMFLLRWADDASSWDVNWNMYNIVYWSSVFSILCIPTLIITGM